MDSSQPAWVPFFSRSCIPWPDFQIPSSCHPENPTLDGVPARPPHPPSRGMLGVAHLSLAGRGAFWGALRPQRSP